MNELYSHSSAAVAIAALVINFVWTSLNLRLLRAMEKKFVTKEQFHAEQRAQGILRQAIVDRLERAGI